MNDHAPIVTLTLNPALDVSSAVDRIVPTDKLRCDTPRVEAGGGGINVSRACQRLGEATLAVAPLGGVVGARLGALLTAESIPYRAVEIAGETRESVSILDGSTGEQFRFVFPGPSLSRIESLACRAAVIEAAANSRCLVISGSMPAGGAGQLLRALVLALPSTAVIIDTSGQALTDALQSGAHMVKPSLKELSQTVGYDLQTDDEIEEAASKLVMNGRIDALVVSTGARGAIVAPAGEPSFRLHAPTVQVRSAVGAGDSMVAGLAVGVRRSLRLQESCALGVAAGSAATLTAGSELCLPADVDSLLDSVVQE